MASDREVLIEATLFPSRQGDSEVIQVSADESVLRSSASVYR